MDTSVTLDRRTAGAANAAPARVRIDDDRAMLKAAADLTRDLNSPNPRIYWTDMLLSVAIGYAALLGAILAPSLGWAIAAGAIAVFALLRARAMARPRIPNICRSR